MFDAGGHTQGDRRRVRALFVSDFHLGTRLCQAEQLLAFLACHDADRIYLIGDIVDGWRLKVRWYWPASHDRVVHTLLTKLQDGGRILYIPGNHDAFLRHSSGLRLGGIEVVDQIIHPGLDGRDYLVVHGDQFDHLVRRMRWVASLGSWVYAAAVIAHDGLDTLWQRLRPGRSRGDDREFARAAVAEAGRQGVQGVICGHLHQAALRDVDGVRYVNTGDWVTSCTAVVEHDDGRFELLNWATAARVSAQAGPAWTDAAAGILTVTPTG